MSVTHNLVAVTIGSVFLSLGVWSCQERNQSVQAARDTVARGHTSLSAADQQFITQAEKDNIKERDLGRVVVEKSGNKDVKAYAQMLIDDHTKALDDIVSLMKSKGMNQPAGLPEVQHEALARLNGISGPTFDREFIQVMIADHKKAVSNFEHEQTAADDAAVRDYAGRILPVVQKHLQKAEDLQSRSLARRRESKVALAQSALA
jgi:putative membrane protein